MKIQEIKPSKRVKGRFLVILDEGTILRVGEQELLDFHLKVGEEISFQEAESLEKSGNLSTLKQKAYNAISSKALSRHDLARKLQRWEASEEEINIICDRFQELKLINDEEYSKMLARHYHRKGYGFRKIQEQFYQHGISRDYWEEALAQLEEETEDSSPLDRLLQQKLKGEKPEEAQLKKVTNALARRGFSWQEIREAVLRYDQAYETIWEESNP